MDRWNGRVALVTGASMGIGAGFCRELVKHGMKVVACARTESKLKELGEELSGEKGEFHPFAMDVSKDDQVAAAFDWATKQLGGVDLCIANAAMAVGGSLLGGKTDDWRQMLDVNVTGTLNVAKTAINGMLQRGVEDGHIVLVGSALGYQVARQPQLHFYSVTKHALRVTASYLRRELLAKKSRIRVSNVSPGYVDTGFASRAMGVPNQVMQGKLKELGMEPLQVQDVVDALVHILSTPLRTEVHDLVFIPTDEDY
ncbi:dehydrogenase/reductase SDR family member 11-like [Ischnura elegans]|uniref:dehydrogenase/reductase SDR family member 11-like n=1 Tax=Ischnura elegans TaxID=197161 RepID=UPI001ED893BA|nr:dehydrogenase/reductase SDR family member 11-like [Ischnura elegans]